MCAHARVHAQGRVCVLLCRSAICSFTWHIDDYEKTKKQTMKVMKNKCHQKYMIKRNETDKMGAGELQGNLTKTAEERPPPYPTHVLSPSI